jgi:dihydropteroate synthase
MIDIGAYSSRPGAADVSPEEETERLSKALSFVAKEYPDLIISVDTFRASVARVCVEKYGVAIINDISAGEMDKDMFRTVSELNVPYIMMHMRGTPQTMKHETAYSDLMGEMTLYFSQKLNELRLLGVKDVILDPGFGFSKTLEQNYEVMRRLDEFKIFELPILVGISRKSMIYNLLGSTPEESLNGTSVLNTCALSKGASILRVHDVKAAVEVVKIMDKMNTK